MTENWMNCQICDASIVFAPLLQSYAHGSETHVCHPHQYAEFYVHDNDSQTIYETAHFRVVRNGEMRIIDGDNIYRYTSDFPPTVKTDEAFELAEVAWEFVNNPWFEVWDKTHSDDDSVIYDYLDDAIYAVEQAEVQLRIAEDVHLSHALDEAMAQIRNARYGLGDKQVE